MGLLLSVVAAAFLMMQSTLRLETATRDGAQLVSAYSDADFSSTDDEVQASNRDIPIMLPVERGQTLGTMLNDFGLQPNETREVLAEVSNYLDPRSVKAGDPFKAYLEDNGALRAFQLVVPAKGKVRLTRDGDKWSPTWQEFERTTRVSRLRGTLDGPLERAIRKAGGNPSVAYLMADALRWDLDFSRDLRRGDRFEAVFEEIYIDGEYHGLGRLLAVVYENRGKRFEGYRYGDTDGFYDAHGRPLSKMFLRSPMKYSRITSRFNLRRFHPVLKTYRPHYGVDYGAPTGTPVRVTASGTVNFAGWGGGAGKMVRVHHPDSYESAYLHLSRFGKGIRPGVKVKQGQVIGYVGSTGLSTGPHLDYRVKHRGKYIDPALLKTMQAEAVGENELADFVAWRDALRLSMSSDDPLTIEPLQLVNPVTSEPQMARQSSEKENDDHDSTGQAR